ncbi:MAG: helix-turn-helix domain-containing protein [Cyclobacteriaceae bacterium]
MADFLHPDNEFLRKVITIIEENLSDEHFEVPDLSERMSMSRSNLLRKVKKLSGFSVSVFIRKVRLHHARELLAEGSLTASEVSYKTGFSSTSYFTKCFREEFGFTPGEGKKLGLLAAPVKEEGEKSYFSKLPAWAIGGFAILTAAILFILLVREIPPQHSLDKSIAVLPFKNDSNDTTNVYIINGLMEAILNNLQKIEDLEVTSRTTVEKYRGVNKTIPELFRELEVNYFVEGSGQKTGNRILLTIQLIDARNDKHIWSQQFERETEDIFKLQMEVAQRIAAEIEAIITPEEQRRIEKIPTDNLVAYDYYLKGLDLTKEETTAGLTEAINYFKRAITEDGTFAQPYAYMAICYYYLDIFQANKQYGLEINTNADKALLIDAELPESLIAKALFYMQDGQYQLAIEFFEKVLQYSPNSGWVHNFLTDIYTNYIPDTRKYLTHALRGIRVAVSDQDSTAASFTYLHLSNALAQTGFIEESEKYVQKSLDYNPNNLFSEYLYSYIRLAQHSDPEQTKRELMATLEKDTTRLDIIQEIAKLYYSTGDYEESWEHYSKYLAIKELYDLDIYPGEDVKIAFVLNQLGREEEAVSYLEAFKEFADQDPSIYRELNLCAYYAVMGDIEKGIKHLKAFTSQKDFIYWIVLMMEEDPIISRLSSHPDYKETINTINENFRARHRETRKMLEEEGVILSGKRRQW